MQEEAQYLVRRDARIYNSNQFFCLEVALINHACEHTAVVKEIETASSHTIVRRDGCNRRRSLTHVQSTVRCTKACTFVCFERSRRKLMLFMTLCGRDQV
jgi:hypothetical protein